MSGIEPGVAAAAAAVREAAGLLITAGAGMGVDSGLPDFRGAEGFWRAYPPFRKLGLQFQELADPRWFHGDPALAWGFYGHRLDLYRRTVPHDGFAILRRWADRTERGAFVFTSNVDGQFQRAGFAEEEVHECHGSIHFLQCLAGCGAGIWTAGGVSVSIDPETMRAAPPFPACPRCGTVARPAILMFGDWAWDSSRSDEQEERLEAWLRRVDGPLAIVELGAGGSIPTVRLTGERLAARGVATLIRVNPREPELPANLRGVSLPLGALEALRRIDALM